MTDVLLSPDENEENSKSLYVYNRVAMTKQTKIQNVTIGIIQNLNI